MKHTQFALLAGLVLLVFAALLIVLSSGFTQEVEAEEKASNIAIYLEEGDSLSLKIPGGRENSSDVGITLHNYNESDDKDRVLLIFSHYMRTSGDTNWNITFLDVDGGEVPFFMRKTEYSFFPIYKFVVKGDGTAVNATLRITHLNNHSPANISDAIELLVFASDYELGTEPEDPEELDRFLQSRIDNEHRNMSYLIARGKHPSTTLSSRITGYISVFSPDVPWTLTSDRQELALESQKEEILQLTLYNYWYPTFPQTTLQAGFKGFSGLNGALHLKGPYLFGEPFQMTEEGLALELILNLSKALEKAPGGDYQLELVASFGNYHNETLTVTVSVPNIHGLYINLTGALEQTARVDGEPVLFHYMISNHGNLVENVSLSAEMGALLVRAGETDSHWSRQFKPSSQFLLEPDQELNVTLEILPAMDNFKIPAGSYPLVVILSSDADTNKTDHALAHITMPWLYSRTLNFQPPTQSSILRPGQETGFRFWVTNTGAIEDIFLVVATLEHQDDGLVSRFADPGDWGFDIIDLYSSQSIQNGSLSVMGPGGSREVRVELRPPEGAKEGVYTLNLSIISSGPGEGVATAQAMTKLESADLFINSWGDITVRKADGSELGMTTALVEGTTVNIKATVHLNGSMNLAVEVAFYYRADLEYELISTQIVDFTGEDGTNVIRTVEIGWKARANENPLIFDNVKVVVDPENKIGEANEDNNVGLTGIMVEKKKDDSPGFAPSFLVVALLAVAFVKGNRRRTGE